MPHEFLRLITEHRVTFLATVPTIMQRLLPVYPRRPRRLRPVVDPRFWHLGAPCPPAVKEAWIELLGPEMVWELYGGTELQALTFISGDQWLTHRGSVGVVVAGEMKVLDDDGRECAPGEVGEIFMRPSPGSAPTYRYIGATAKIRDGWDSLGDLGYFDADGFLYLSDRRVDMFTVGGRNVYPAEIESALCRAPGRAVLLGRWRSRRGSRPGAVCPGAGRRRRSTRPRCGISRATGSPATRCRALWSSSTAAAR